MLPPLGELGTTSGLLTGQSSWKSWSTGDDLEQVPELQWPISPITYARMLNDAQLNALYQGWAMAIRSWRWYINPNGAPDSAVQRIAANYNLPIGRDTVEFNRRRTTRRFSWEKHLEDALRSIVYGHYFFEQVGEIDYNEANDTIAWNLRKLGVRAPRTIAEIEIKEDGGLDFVKQSTAYNAPKIPINRLVAYVWDKEGSNWVGRSQLRPCYRNYLVKDRVLRVGAINIERAGGVPYIQAPEGASGEQIQALDALARRFRVGEGAGAALPHGAQLKFAQAAGGSEAINFIKFQNEEMGRNFMAGVQMLGAGSSGAGGSFALGKVQDNWLDEGQQTAGKFIRDTFNEHVIEDDVEWNEGPSCEYAPLLEFDTSNGMNPEAGLQAVAEDEENGLKVEPGGEVEAMIGLRRTHRPRWTGSQRYETASSNTTMKANQQQGAGDAEPSPQLNPAPAAPSGGES